MMGTRVETLAKGAKLKASDETDTIYRDTTIYVAGENTGRNLLIRWPRYGVPGKQKVWKAKLVHWLQEKRPATQQ